MKTKEKKASLFTIRHESATCSGTWSVLATSQEEAAELFREEYELYGDPVPSFWFDGTWAIG